MHRTAGATQPRCIFNAPYGSPPAIPTMFETIELPPETIHLLDHHLDQALQTIHALVDARDHFARNDEIRRLQSRYALGPHHRLGRSAWISDPCPVRHFARIDRQDARDRM